MLVPGALGAFAMLGEQDAGPVMMTVGGLGYLGIIVCMLAGLKIAGSRPKFRYTLRSLIITQLFTISVMGFWIMYYAEKEPGVRDIVVQLLLGLATVWTLERDVAAMDEAARRLEQEEAAAPPAARPPCA